MSTIRTIYLPNADGSRQNPGFPATAQHPLAVRYPFDHPTLGALNVDAINGPPIQAEIDAQQGIDAAGQAVSLRRSTDATEAALVKADANVLTFLNMSPTDLDAWIDQNIGSAGTPAAAVVKVVVALKVLGRIALAAGRGKSLRNGG